MRYGLAEPMHTEPRPGEPPPLGLTPTSLGSQPADFMSKWAAEPFASWHAMSAAQLWVAKIGIALQGPVPPPVPAAPVVPPAPPPPVPAVPVVPPAPPPPVVPPVPAA